MTARYMDKHVFLIGSEGFFVNADLYFDKFGPGKIIDSS